MEVSDVGTGSSEDTSGVAIGNKDLNRLGCWLQLSWCLRYDSRYEVVIDWSGSVR